MAEKVRRDADLNDFCLVTLWELGEARLLSMSDLPGTYEPYVATPADVLKVGHHGQADSTGSAFCADCGAGGGAGFRGGGTWTWQTWRTACRGRRCTGPGIAEP